MRHFCVWVSLSCTRILSPLGEFLAPFTVCQTLRKRDELKGTSKRAVPAPNGPHRKRSAEVIDDAVGAWVHLHGDGVCLVGGGPPGFCSAQTYKGG
jgi:hypothetical protein